MIAVSSVICGGMEGLIESLGIFSNPIPCRSALMI